jgi:hypothetical protein
LDTASAWPDGISAGFRRIYSGEEPSLWARLCPAFWDWLIVGNRAGFVASIEKVGDELLAGADELSDWARARDEAFFLKPDQSILPCLAAVSAWATSQQHVPAAVSTFLQLADYYDVVAQAHAGGHTVVTHEVSSGSTRRIKIPDACIGVNVKCVTPFEMLRTERARFILGQ